MLIPTFLSPSQCWALINWVPGNAKPYFADLWQCQALLCRVRGHAKSCCAESWQWWVTKANLCLPSIVISLIYSSLNLLNFRWYCWVCQCWVFLCRVWLCWDLGNAKFYSMEYSFYDSDKSYFESYSPESQVLRLNLTLLGPGQCWALTPLSTRQFCRCLILLNAKFDSAG
jgi:hypothetical protein